MFILHYKQRCHRNLVFFHWGQYELKIRDVIIVKHTCVFNIILEVEGAVGICCIIEAHGVVEGQGVVEWYGGVKKFKLSSILDGPSDTFLSQISHKELKANEGENSKGEDGQNHDVHHFLHWLDQSSHDGFQTWNTSEILVVFLWKFATKTDNQYNNLIYILLSTVIKT